MCSSRLLYGWLPCEGIIHFRMNLLKPLCHPSQEPFLSLASRSHYQPPPTTHGWQRSSRWLRRNSKSPPRRNRALGRRYQAEIMNKVEVRKDISATFSRGGGASRVMQVQLVKGISRRLENKCAFNDSLSRWERVRVRDLRVKKNDSF